MQIVVYVLFVQRLYHSSMRSNSIWLVIDKCPQLASTDNDATLSPCSNRLIDKLMLYMNKVVVFQIIFSLDYTPIIDRKDACILENSRYRTDRCSYTNSLLLSDNFNLGKAIWDYFIPCVSLPSI